MNYRSVLLIVLSGLLILGLVASVIANMTFGFLHLLLVFVILIIIPLSFPPRKAPEDNNEDVDNTPIPPHYARIGSLFLIILLLCCYIALNNYINPSSQVFNNNDHHAVRVDGLEINNPNGFVLAADNDQAFLDTVGFPGEATIADVGGGMVQLRLRGVTRPVYRYYYNENLRNYKQEIINYEESFIVGPSNPSFTLINNANHRLKVTIEEHEYKKHWYSIYSSDSTTYWFQLDEQEPQKAAFSTYLHTGYELDRILPEIEGFDLMGISLVRPIVRPTAMRNEVFKELGGLYSFDIKSEALRNRSIRAIECNGQTFELSALADKEISISIPFGQTIVFGYGEVHTEPLSFAESKEGNSGIQLKYNCPFYRTLSKISGEARNTLYITSTLGSGNDVVDPDLPENVLLFDFFHRLGNRHNMVPSYLTFISGPTNEPLKMQLAVGNTLTKDVQAGTPFQHIGVRATSQDDIFGENWMVSVQNFRATTPFSQLKICLYLLLLTILSIIVLNVRKRNDDNVRKRDDDNVRKRDDESLVTYSHVELAAYMLILCLMTIRLFLMWRMSVFPPVNSITNFELHNFFWQGSMWKWFYLFTIVFYVALFYFKHCVLQYQNYNLFRIFNILTIRDKYLGRVIDGSANSASDNDVDPMTLAREQREILQNSINNVKVSQDNDQLKTFKEFGKEIYNDKFIGIFFLLSLLIGALCFLGRSFRWCTIFIPIISYFLGDMLLTARYGRTYKEDMDEKKEEGHTASYLRTLHVKPFILTSFNMLFWSIILFFNDSGFGILFLSFGLIWTQLKLREIDLYLEGKGGGWINLLLILMVGLLVFYKDLFLLAISNPCFFILSCGLIAFVIVLLVCRILAGHFKKGIIWGISASSALVTIIGALLLANVVIPGNHIEQRIRVHMSSPAEQLSSIGDAQTERRFLEASLNDWILAEYYNDGKDIKLLGDWGHSYFQLKPHSKLGAMWGAQASDISLSRYVIAEHGHLLPIVLICAFLLLLCIGISRSSHSRVAKGLMIQIPLLLFVQSLLIWMTVTRRFIFLGQDFPLISCNSKVTILYTLALLAIWICAMIHETMMVSNRSIKEDNSIIRSSTQNMWYFLFLMFIVGIVFSMKQVISHYQSGVYELSDALENLSQTLNRPIVDVSELQIKDNRHNNHLAISNAPTREDNLEEEEQDETIGILYSINDLIDIWQAAIIDRNDTAYYRHNIADIGNTHSVMKAFDATYGKYIENALDKDESMRLTKRLYRHYIDKLSRRNSYDGILHMHRNRSTGRATLAVRTDYYHASLPSRPRYSWTGNVIGSTHHSAIDNRINTINYNLTRFPGRWFKDGQDVVILKRKNGIFSIRSKGSEAPLNIDENILSQSVRIFPQDKVSMGARNVDLSTIMPEQSIWARNLQVNGQRRFVYPLQDKNFWIRNFTNEMKLIAEKRLRDKEESQLGDIQITPDQELELAIYRTIERSNLIGEERAVVVANGNGHVCAMVDFKTPNYRLDPNDEKRILDMDKKLYMIGGHGSDEERRCLGSSALLPLRFGMGSTQKPLVYAAVTAGFDLGCPGSPFTGWSALNLDTIRLRCVEMKRGDILQRHYTGIPFHKNSPFRSPFGDEGDTGMVNPLYYIRRSSNYYNSILVFMGSYPADFYSPARVSSFLQIAPSKDETTMLRRVKEPRFMSRQEYEEAWPIMRIGGRPLAFNISPVSVDQTKSLLQLQFEKLFGLSASFKRNDKTSLYSSISDSIRLSYVYPEPSFLDAKMRTQKGREFAEKTIRQTATGQRMVWNVSPLMMAQMYARLLPGQAKIKLNIDPNCPHPPYANLQSDSNNFDEVMNTIYRGMHEVFTGGTANLVYSNLVRNGYLSATPATTSPNRFPNKHYWIYGKTGTIGKDIDKKTGRMLRDNDRLLAVVITDHDLTDPELDPDNLHYYVIFMTFYNTPSTYSGLQAEIIKRVMDSDEFKEYM